MTHYPSRVSHYLRGGDPAPTDAEALRTVIGVLQTVTDYVADAHAVLANIGRHTSMWSGSGAAAFEPTAQDLKSRLLSAQTAYGDALDGLRGWLRKLEPLQAEAVTLAAQADTIGPHVGQPSPLAFIPLPDQLVPLQRHHGSIVDRWTRDAAACAQAIDIAIGIVKQYERSRWQGVLDFVSELKHSIDKVTGWVGGLAVLLCWVPILGEVLAGAALILAGISEVMSLILVTNNRESWGEFGKDTFWTAISFASAGLGAAGRGARASEALGEGSLAAARTARGEARLAGEAGPDSDLGRFLGGQSVHSAQDASDLSRGSRAAEKDVSLQGFKKGIHDELTGDTKDQKQFDELVRQSETYKKLPTLDSWLPPGHRVVSGADIGARSLEAAHSGTDIGGDIADQIVDHYVVEQSPQPIPGDSGSPDVNGSPDIHSGPDEYVDARVIG